MINKPHLKFLMKILPIFSLMLFSSCYRVTVTTGDDNPLAKPYMDGTRVHVSGFLWGIIGADVNAKDVCGSDPVQSVIVMRTPANTAVGWLTCGIYTPSTAVIACKKVL